MLLSEIAERLSCELEGDGRIEIKGVATLESATGGNLSFLTNAKYYNDARATKASAIIAGHDCPPLHIPILRNANPYLVFAKAIELFHQRSAYGSMIHPTASIADTARVGKGVYIGAFSYIGDHVVLADDVKIAPHCSIGDRVQIGEKTFIDSGCVVHEEVVIGKRCLLQSNSVIGSDGFGYAKQDNGEWYKILQAGTVIIEDDVEIGAGTTIDRATLGETRISKGAKIDNLVQIGHGSSVGSHSLICAQVGLAGSSKIGSEVVLAGQVGIAGHLHVGDKAVLTAQSGTSHDIEPGKVMSGSPAFDNKRWLRSTAIITKLPEIQKTIREIERRVAILEKETNN